MIHFFLYLPIFDSYLDVSFFFWFYSLRHSQHFFSYVGTGLTWLNQYLARIYAFCPKTQNRDAGALNTSVLIDA